MFSDISLRELPGSDLGRAKADEARRMRRLRATADLTAAILRQQTPLTEEEARSLIAATRRSVLELFPGSECTFDLILKPRFERILRERVIGENRGEKSG